VQKQAVPFCLSPSPRKAAQAHRQLGIEHNGSHAKLPPATEHMEQIDLSATAIRLALSRTPHTLESPFRSNASRIRQDGWPQLLGVVECSKLTQEPWEAGSDRLSQCL
jgi:hypothetical protein